MSDFPPFNPQMPPNEQTVPFPDKSEKPKRRGRGPARKPRKPAMKVTAAPETPREFTEKQVKRHFAAKVPRVTDEHVFADIAKSFQQLPAAKRTKFLDMLTRIFS